MAALLGAHRLTLRKRRSRSWYVSTAQQLVQARLASPGDTIYLQRGARFRAELKGLRVGVKVRAYGEGARPIIDGRDIASNAAFTATPGRAHVYQIAWIHGLDTSKSLHRAWENDVMMTRAASIAACDASPGSFFAGLPTAGGPDLIYIHPADSTNPITNGREYALSSRQFCVQLYELYNQADVIGLEAIGNSYADGAICVDGRVEDCVARDGRIHNFFVLGTAVNCQARGIEAGFGTMFVSYVDPGFGGGPFERNVVYRGCVADAQGNGGLVEAYYAHSNGQGRVLGTIQFEMCHAAGCRTGWSASETRVFLCYGCTYQGCNNAYIFGYAQGRAVLLGGSGRLTNGLSTRLMQLGNGIHTAHGLKSYHPGNSASPVEINSSTATVLIDRCTVWTAAGGACRYFRGTVTVRRSVIAGGNFISAYVGSAAANIDSYVGDRNCYFATSAANAATAKDFGGQVFFVTLASWRAYLATQGWSELDTIAANPLLADPANLDFTVGNPAVLALGAGAEPNEDDDPELQALWEQYRIS